MAEIDPLFIVGAPRSGTSLTRDLVRLIKGVYLPPDEVQIIPVFLRHCLTDPNPAKQFALFDDSTFASHMRRRGLWLTDDELRERLACDNPAHSIQRVILKLSELEGVDPPRYWGDKTPYNIFAIDLLLSAWPSARILYINRDPRDVVLSMHRAWGKSIVRAAVLWRDAARVGESLGDRVPEQQLHTLKYEELTASPAERLCAIAEWLGLTFDEADLGGFRTQERWGRAAGKTGVVSAQSDWHKLPSKALDLIEGIALREMVACGYSPRRDAIPHEPHPLRLALAGIGDAFRSVRSYSQDRGLVSAVIYKAKQWRYLY